MKTVIVALLIALFPVALGMIILREFLFFAVVAPTIQRRGFRFWLNSLLGGTKKQHIHAYINQLSNQQRKLWQNRFLANANLLIGIVVVSWFALLLLAR